jgi:transient receptor potential cation channel subfamily M member 1
LNSSTRSSLPISVFEVILIICVSTIFIEEIRKFSVNENKVFKAKFKSFFNNTWNIVVICAVILFVIGLVIRFIPDSYEYYLIARILWCIDIILWFIKSLHGYTINRNLGPKLFIITKMIINLIYFLLIVVLFMFAFGISTHSLSIDFLS